MDADVQYHKSTGKCMLEKKVNQNKAQEDTFSKEEKQARHKKQRCCGFFTIKTCDY